MSARIAKFDENDHATVEGWATYQGVRMRRPPMWRFSLRCQFGHHKYPTYTPEPPNGHSPSNHDPCARCKAHLGWFVVGQHRWGGYDRDVFNAYRERSRA